MNYMTAGLRYTDILAMFLLAIPFIITNAWKMYTMTSLAKPLSDFCQLFKNLKCFQIKEGMKKYLRLLVKVNIVILKLKQKKYSEQ